MAPDYGHEGAPLVVGDTMYLVTPYPNIAYALDLSKPGAPIKWSFAPNPSPMAIGKACCDAVLRGWALADGKLIYNLLDAHTVAVDAKTGKEVWRTKMDNVENGATMTMSAAVYGGKVFVGNSGGELGVHGWLAALDVKTGKELWRAYNTGPDDQAKIGADYNPFYDWMKGKDLGATTWPQGMAVHGGSASWGWVTYDPDLNLIYYGTSNPSPRVPAQRPGLNLCSAAVWARDADTGMAKWAYQFTPHDQWDYDGVNENVLIDIPYQGQTRKVLVQFNRNGFAYTIDRQTGEVLVAQPFGNLNWATGIDMKTGQPIVNPAMQPKPGIKLQNACPTDIGVKDWQPSAFSPRTGLLYTGMFNICMDVTDHRQSYIAGTPYDGMEMTRHAGPGGNWGAFIAWDPVHGKKAWEIPEKFMVMSGALTTASDLVFYGTVDGWFRAVNAVTGEVLWSQKLGSGIVSPPITYMGPDGAAVRRHLYRRRRRRDGREPASRFPAARQHALRIQPRTELDPRRARHEDDRCRRCIPTASQARTETGKDAQMRAALLVLMIAGASVSGCGQHTHADAEAATDAPASAAIPGGDIAGGSESHAGAAISNPVEGQPAAIAEGKRLFVQMNCAGCHGYTLGGSMGPNLTDRYWRYGGTPGAIFASIADGHPKGMPAWAKALPDDEIWQLVAYIQSFGGATPPADFQSGLQGDETPKSGSPGGGTGAHSGARGAESKAAQTANP